MSKANNVNLTQKDGSLDFPTHTVSDLMFSRIMRTPALNTLSEINEQDPTLSLRGFCERCLNSVEMNGAKFTADVYNVPMEFLQSLGEVYLQHNSNV